MAIGTIEGSVVVANSETHCRLAESRRQLDTSGNTYGDCGSVLSLSWLHLQQSKFLTGYSDGLIRLYNFKPQSCELEILSTYPRFLEEMTSVHCSAFDRRGLACGYSRNVVVFDRETGSELQTYHNIHNSSINISRFANTIPHLFLTCSFDKRVCLWDLRQKTSSRPIHTNRSETGNVMVCFSPDDRYYLVSSVDNEVNQYETAQGSHSLSLQLPRTGSAMGYTRSYYGGLEDGQRLVVTASSSEDVVRVCSGSTGQVMETIQMYPGRRHPSLHVQSLRAHPNRPCRLGVLCFYRHMAGYELCDVDFRRSPQDSQGDRGCDFACPASILASHELSRRLRSQLVAEQSRRREGVVELLSSANPKVCYRCDWGLLEARWPWLASQRIPGHPSIQTCFPADVLRIVLEFIYTGGISRSLVCIESDEEEISTKLIRCHQYVRRMQLTRLLQLLELALQRSLTLLNTMDVWLYARHLQESFLPQCCQDMITRHWTWFNVHYPENPDVREAGQLWRESLCDVKGTNWVARAGHAVVLVNLNQVFVLGGYSRNGPSDLDQVPMLDLTRNARALLPSYGQVPDALTFHAASLAADAVTIVCIGGGQSNFAQSIVYTLHTPTMRWRQIEQPLLAPLSSLQPSARARHSVTLANDKLLLFGGRDQNAVLGGTYAMDASSLQWIRATRPETTASWEAYAPSPRCSHTATFLPATQQLVVLGGFTSMGMAHLRYADVFDLATCTWQCIALESCSGRYPLPRCCHSCVLLDAKGSQLVLSGGRTGPAHAFAMNAETLALDDIWLLDVGDRAWRELKQQGDPALVDQLARNEHCSFMLPDGRVGVWGGSTEVAIRGNELLAYDVERQIWELVPTYLAWQTPEPAVSVIPLQLHADLQRVAGDVRVEPCANMLSSKMLLCAGSTLFQAMLLRTKTAEAQTSTVDLSGTYAPAALRIVLMYLQTGIVPRALLDVGEKQGGVPLMDAAACARMMAVAGLSAELEHYLAQHLDQDNVWSLLSFARRHYLDTLVESCSWFLQKNLAQLSRHPPELDDFMLAWQQGGGSNDSRAITMIHSPPPNRKPNQLPSNHNHTTKLRRVT